MYKLDEKTSVIKDCILQMANQVLKMHHMVITALVDGDIDKSLKVIEMDNYVNSYEAEINELSIETLALLQPVAKDLRFIIASIKIASELERIGDYAKNLATYVIKNGKIDDNLKELSIEVGNTFINMLEHSIEAYDKNDTKMAMIIPEEDEKINELFKIMLNVITEEMINNKNIVINVYTVAALRNFERAGDHTKNICEHIIYQIKGHHVELN